MTEEEKLRSVNRSLCEALASMTKRAHAAEHHFKRAGEILDEADGLLLSVLLNTGPDRMGLQDRRVIMQARERLVHIKKLEATK